LAAVLACLALAVALVRQSESARVADAATHLAQAASQMAERYDYLRRSFTEGRTRLPLDGGDDLFLHSLTATALSGLPGVEGGFYRASDQRLVGYAYPTYRGSGPKTDIPAAERPTIEQVAARAVLGRGPAEERVVAGPDLILFRALPLGGTAAPIGAVWVMERLAGVRTAQGQLYLAGLMLVLVFSCAVAALAWMFTRRLDRGVARIELGLQAMEAKLDTPVPETGIAELDRVSGGINRLGRAVQEHQRQRAELEMRLHRVDRLAALGRLVAGVAHEVRNPLASIKLKVHVALRSAEEPASLAGVFEVIEEEIERLNRLVERLLTLAKPAESDRLPTDLSRLLQARVELWEGRATEQGIVLQAQKQEPALEPIAVDGDRVAQIVDNLIGNAVEALRGRGGRITVTLHRSSAREVIVRVADTGSGVPPELVDRLFEPFFTTRDGGTGLGLFLSAELTRALGGEVHYRDRPGGGACFEVRLPC